MNTGMVDASVLGSVLIEVLSGRRDESYLDRYEALRRPAALQVLDLAGRLTGMATVKSALGRKVRNVLLTVFGKLPTTRYRLQMNLSGLARRPASVLSAR
jgi:2-polyprenyl-6-methoxyphenol hydroxylase-like FAD-dependent oxidoreductase